MNDFFIKCNMVIRTQLDFVKFNSKITIPFLFHIKDVNSKSLFGESENNIDFYSQEVCSQQNSYSKIDDALYCLSYIDKFQFTIDDIKGIEKYNFIKYNNNYIFSDTYNMYLFLIEELTFNDTDFLIMKKFIKQQLERLLISFVKMAEKSMDIGNKSDKVTEDFMLLRGAFELNHQATIFPENQGKSFSEWSFIEIKLQRLYLARKCEIEQIQLEAMKKEGRKNKK